MPWSRPRPLEDFMARLQRAADSIETSDDFYRFVGVSVMLDGGCNGGFIRMRRPYRGPYGEEAHGRNFITLEKAELVMRFAAEHLMRLNIIALGPAAHDDNLAMLDRVAESYDIASLGWVLVHGFFVEPQQVEHYARLGFDLTTSMSFTWGKGDMLVERIGADAMGDFLPLRRFLDAGMAVAAGTDWGPKNPWEQIQLALTHEFAGSGRRNLGPAQTVTREEAVAMWTSGGSRLLQWPEIGTLAPGSYADIIVVDRDPLTADLDALPGTRVLRTIVDGEVVHDSGDL
jgi:predicted amidohydrolase YtcJ